MAANWQSTESFAVPQAIDETSTVKRNPIGMVVSARDISTQPASGTGTQGNATGYGQFIYLVATAAQAAGDAVVYELPDSTDLNGKTTQIDTDVAASLKGSVAIAMAAFGAGEFGWYQIYGNAIINNGSHAGAADVPLYASATAGALTSVAADSVGILTSYVLLAKGQIPEDSAQCLARIQYPSVFTQAAVKQL
jgi:hypothetical protein